AHQPEHRTGNEVGDPVQPLIAPGNDRAATRPPEARPGWERHEHARRLQPLAARPAWAPASGAHAAPSESRVGYGGQVLQSSTTLKRCVNARPDPGSGAIRGRSPSSLCTRLVGSRFSTPAEWAFGRTVAFLLELPRRCETPGGRDYEAEQDRDERDRTPPVLPECAEAVAALPATPKEA